MEADKSVDAPADAILYAKNLFRVRAAEPKPSLLRRVIAIIQADLVPGTAAFGERSGGEGQARQMLFDSGENAVDLRIQKDGSRFTIRGQILGDGFENGTAEIASANSTVTANIDDLGEFRFEGVAAGDYSMTVRGVSDEIIIDSLSIS